MNPGMRMDHIRWMSGRVWSWAISTGLAACALVWAHTAEAQEAECRNGQGLKCWFIIGEAYKAPKRVAFIARHADRGAVDGKRALEVVQVIESADIPDRYAIWEMEVDCGRRTFRILRDRAADKSGSIRQEPSHAPDWKSLEAAQYGESIAFPFACDSEVIKDRSSYLAAFAGNAYRVPDMVSQFRRVIWSEGR